jgi:uncharacterized protein YbaP (TraB family)
VKIRLILLSLMLATASLNGQMLWRVTAPNGKVSFLFGTMHLASVNYLDDHSAILDSLAQCKTIVAEVDLTDKTAMFNFYDYARLPDSTYLKDGLTPREWAVMDSMLQLMDPPMNGDVYNGYKPALVENALIQNMFTDVYKDILYDRFVPIDMGIIRVGYRDGYRMEFLESAYEQLDVMFNRVSTESQYRSLKMLLNGDRDSATREYMSLSLQMPRLYEEQKLDSLSRIIDLSLTVDSACKEQLQYLLIDRNNHWLKKLEFWFPNGGYFVAVGAGHLVKEYGLLAQLRKRGYKTEPVFYR